MTTSASLLTQDRVGGVAVRVGVDLCEPRLADAVVRSAAVSSGGALDPCPSAVVSGGRTAVFPDAPTCNLEVVGRADAHKATVRGIPAGRTDDDVVALRVPGRQVACSIRFIGVNMMAMEGMEGMGTGKKEAGVQRDKAGEHQCGHGGTLCGCALGLGGGGG